MKRELTIENLTIDDDSDCFVIAEIGHNHMGSLETCRELFRVAKECGVDAVKLQKRDNKTLYTKSLYNQVYDNPNSYGATYGQHREALEFGSAEYKELKDCAKELGLTFFSTAFDMPSADFLAAIDMPVYKIASGDLCNTPLLRHVARLGKPMILSTGGGSIDDIRRAVETVASFHNKLAILQCTAAYPCEYDELNLRVIETLRVEFPGLVIGLSDHERGISMSVAAYVLGARIVEKHFTLARTNRGTDHAFSLEPIGLKRTIRDLRRIRVSLGDGVKRTYPSEIKPLQKMMKSLYAKHDLKAGTVLGEDHIAFKSPGGAGFAPYRINEVLGRRVKIDLAEDTILLDEHFSQ